MKRAIMLAAAAFAWQASAQCRSPVDINDVNLDATSTERDVSFPIGIFNYSLETLSGASDKTITVVGKTYYAGPENGIGIWKKIDVRGTSGRTVFTRYDLENMVFFDYDPTDYESLIPRFNFALEAGGGDGSSYVISSAPADEEFSQNTLPYFRLKMAVLPDAPGTITYGVYLNLSDAIQRRGSLSTKTKTLVVPARSLRHEVTPGVATATAASGFTQLADADANAIGTLTIGVVGGGGYDAENCAGVVGSHYSQTGGLSFDDEVRVTHTLTDIAKAGDVATGRGSFVTFRGDFSIGTYLAHTADRLASCGTAPLTTRRNDEVLEKITVAAASGITSLCIAVPATNTAEIPVGQYTVQVDYEGLTNAAFPPVDLAETPIGRIRRDGTRVQIPFLTTWSGCNQNVVIVNRNRGPVSYAFEFILEEGVTATPGTEAEGTVPANSVAVLKSTDIVRLSGQTRTAATLDVVAASGTVDVAVTLMNERSADTDTVLLEGMQN